MIVKIPNPVLTAPAKPVTKIDRKILEIIGRMKKSLVETNHPKGVGLAASQIGLGLQIFITRPSEESPIEVFINPEIIYRSRDLAEIERLNSNNKSTPSQKKLEGCLSIPNVWGYLKRHKTVRLRYLSLQGKTEEKEFTGFMSTIVQHETDHLQGILFTQRVLEQNQQLYRIDKTRSGDEKLIEIEI